MPASASVPLWRFQDAFARALVPGSAPADAIVAGIVAQPAFALYRNTVMKGCIDALQASFPAVARLVGEEWFRAAAAVYVAGEPPREPSLLAYGAAFPAFLDGFTPAAELTYLSGVALLDRHWTEAHVATDAPVLGRAALANLDPETLAGAVLHPHPAARWAWFADTPVYTIWRRNREESGSECGIDWRGEGAVITRPVDAVRWNAIDAASWRFLDTCAKGMPVARAIEAALEADGNANLVRLVSTLLDAGAFGRLALPTENPSLRHLP